MSGLITILKDNTDIIPFGNIQPFINKLNGLLKKLHSQGKYKCVKEINNENINNNGIYFIEDQTKININVYENDKIKYKSDKNYIRTLNLELVENPFNEVKQYILYKKYNMNCFKHNKIALNHNKTFTIYNIKKDKFKVVEDKQKKLIDNAFNISRKILEGIYNPNKEDINDIDLLNLFIEDVKEINLFQLNKKYKNQPIKEYDKLLTPKIKYNILSFNSFNDFILENIYNNTNKYNIKCDKIELEELNFIDNINGQLVFNDKINEDKDYYKYDISSCYPFALYNSNTELNDLLYVPISKGKITNNIEFNDFIKYLNNKKLLNYSIYNNIKIIKNGKNNLQKLIKINNHGYYTNIDLNMAFIAECDFELLDSNNKISCINWCKVETNNKPNKCIKSNYIFGPFIQDIYNMKRQLKHNRLIKNVLSRIHGIFIQLNKYVMYLFDEEDYELDEEDELKFIHYNTKHFINRKGEKKKKETYLYKNQLFKSNYARLKPFIYSFTRLYLFNTIIKYNLQNNIYSIRTDSILTDIKINDFERDKDTSNNKQLGRFYREEFNKSKYIEKYNN